MTRRLTTIAFLAAAAAVLSGCGGDSSEQEPAGDPSVGGVTEAGCVAEIKRQLQNPELTTKSTPPQCQGIADERLAELANAAVAEIVKTAKPTSKPK